MGKSCESADGPHSKSAAHGGSEDERSSAEWPYGPHLLTEGLQMLSGGDGHEHAQTEKSAGERPLTWFHRGRCAAAGRRCARLRVCGRG